MRGTFTSTLSITEVIEHLLDEFQRRIQKRDLGAVDFGIDAYSFSKDIGNKDLIVRSCRALSQFYTDIKSEFHQSIKVLEVGINLLDDEENYEDKAELYRLLGLNYDYMGQLIKSKYAYDEAIRLLEVNETLSNKGKLVMARSQFNLSIIYGRLELPALADVCLKNSYQQYQALNEKAGIARCYISFGVQIEESQGDPKEAFEFYRKATALSAEIGDDVSYSVARGNMAIKLAEWGQHDEALEAGFDALEKANRSANKRYQLNLYRQLGRCYHLKGDYESSQKCYQEGENIFSEMGISVDYYNLYGYWSEMLHDAGKYKEAYAKLKKAQQQQEEMHAFHKSAAINDAMLRFQFEEGKKEQELLKKKNSEIEQYAHKLETSNFELKQFAHVAAHDMKEPLRMISNYSQLLKKSLNGSINPEQSEYLSFLNDGAKRMLNLIDNLIQWNNMSLAPSKERVDINNIVEVVKDNLSSEIENKSVVITADPLPVMQTDPIAMLNLFTHLMHNAIKYNTAIDPTVQISCSESDEEYNFEVADNGIGIAEEYREKVFAIFQRLHARNEFEGTGIGLTICKKIIDNLNGKIWIEASDMGGARFCFTIPK